MTPTKIKLIAAGLAALGLVGIWLYVGRIPARAELALLRAETAEGLAETLAEANAKLKAINTACNLAAAAQGLAASAVLARRDTLDDIMFSPVIQDTAESQNKTRVYSKQEELTDDQSRKLVDFYNDVFGGLRPK